MNTDTEKTFDNFIVGKSNQFAYKASKALVSELKGPLNNYNPLFIFGDAGLGKTHLLHAICNEIIKNDSDIKIAYSTAEEFANEYYAALVSKSTDKFHEKYKNNTDVLVLDDIQFILGKSATEKEVYNIINTLLENKKKVILATNTNPCKITDTNGSLYSRFALGLVSEITSPEYEIRYSIVKNTAKKFELDVPEEVIEYIANKITSNIPQLQCVTNSICANCSFCNLSPSVKLAEKVINQIQGNNYDTK